MYKRYGEFRFRDYVSAWFGILIFCVLLVSCFFDDTPFHVFIWLLLLVVTMVWSIYRPNSERFTISDDVITTVHGRKKRKIPIPSESMLIVSYADVMPPWAKRIGCMNQSYMLKGRCAISILQNIPLETALAELHRNYALKYTNNTVEVIFDASIFVYSFVVNQEMLDKLLYNRNCQVIIPETLLNQISIDSHRTNVHIDVGY